MRASSKNSKDVRDARHSDWNVSGYFAYFGLGIILLGCAQAIDHEVGIVTTTFDSVTWIRTAPVPKKLPSHEVVSSFPAGSSYYRSTELAVSPDGDLAVGEPWLCSVILVDADTGGSLGQFDACGDRGETITDLFWLDDRVLGVFDMDASEIRLFEKTGERLHDIAVHDPALPGTVTAAFPLAEGDLIVSAVTPFSVDDNTGRDAPILLEVRTASEGDLVRRLLAPPPVAFREDLRYQFGVELCVVQSLPPDGMAFVAASRWAHDIVVVGPGGYDTAHRIARPVEEHFYYTEQGRLSPLPGRFAVACGETGAIAQRTIFYSENAVTAQVVGVLDWISVDGELIERFDLAFSPEFARSREIGIDRRNNAYAMLLDSTELRIIRQPMTGTAGDHQ